MGKVLIPLGQSSLRNVPRQKVGGKLFIPGPGISGPTMINTNAGTHTTGASSPMTFSGVATVSEFTFSAWVKTTNTASHMYLMMNGASNSSRMLRIYRPATSVFVVELKPNLAGANTLRIQASGSGNDDLANGQLTHLCISAKNDGSSKMYIDGVDVGNVTTDWTSGTAKFDEATVGCWFFKNETGNQWIGCVGDVFFDNAQHDISKFYPYRDPGADGSNYTGSQPVFFVGGTMQPADWNGTDVNLGHEATQFDLAAGPMAACAI